MSIELLAPAGNFAKLNTAFYFGADAVYVGGKDFSLRSFADNFTRDELVSAVKYAHALGKKIYVTANVFAKNTDLRLMEDYFGFLGEAGADAVIVSDSGVFHAGKSHQQIRRQVLEGTGGGEGYSCKGAFARRDSRNSFLRSRYRA